MTNKFKYFDPITLEELPITEETALYLVKIGEDKFHIKGVSCNLDQLPCDPTTNLMEYWPLKTLPLLENESLHDKIFPDNQLREASLCLKEVIEYFAYDPDKKKKFSKAVLGDLPGAIQGYLRDSDSENLASLPHHQPAPEAMVRQEVILRQMSRLNRYSRMARMTPQSNRDAVDFFYVSLIINSYMSRLLSSPLFVPSSIIQVMLLEIINARFYSQLSGLRGVSFFHRGEFQDRLERGNSNNLALAPVSNGSSDDEEEIELESPGLD